MSDSHPPEPSPAPRPTRPVLNPRPLTHSRPIRPTTRPAATAAIESPAAVKIVEATLVAPPPPPAARPRTPSRFAAVGLRKTLLPPCVVLAIGLIGLGGAYFLQPPDAALRQVAVAVPTALLAAGFLAAACAVLLGVSLRRH